MIPESLFDSYFDPPVEAWAPAPDELDDTDGVGFFRDVWRIHPSPVSEIRDLIRWERTVVHRISGLSASVEEFDYLAGIIESFYTDGDSSIADEYPEVSTAQEAPLQRCLDHAPRLLDGIDLGVAGLVESLSAVGFVTAASCRGHVGPAPWAEGPTVIFGGDRDRVFALKQAVLQNACGLEDASGNGPGLVVVRAPSVIAAMNLAESLLDVGVGHLASDA